MKKDIQKEFSFNDLYEGKEKKILKEVYSSSADYAFWIKDKYFFKSISDIRFFLQEKLVEKIAQEVGIETIETWYGELGKIKGEVSLNYKKENCLYKSGTKILEEYRKHLEETQKEIPINMNNLETIKEALAYLYPDSDSLMPEFTKRFILDLLTMQSDRISENWEIEENEQTKKVRLAPYFDSDKIFTDHSAIELVKYGRRIHNPFLIKCDYDKESALMSTYDKIYHFLIQASQPAFEYFEILLEQYPKEKIEFFLNEISQDIDVREEIKTSILRDYECHYEKMQELLSLAKEERRGLFR